MSDADAPSAAEIVDRACAAALYADDDLSLDTGASVLAADPARWEDVSRELLVRAEGLVGQAWRRGWRPEDVARLVRRDLGEPALARYEDFVAAEARRHVGRRPARWPEPPPVWWGGDDARWAGEAARREREDRFGFGGGVLGLLRLLVRLPSIEPAGPWPGRDGVGEGPAELPEGGHIEPRMLSRIRALLAKAEATPYPEEAEALTAKAQELIARHTVDEALLAASGRAPAQPPIAVRIGVEPPYEEAKALLLHAVAEANRCRAVWNAAFEFTTVVGFEGDAEAVELLYTSLMVQGTAAMTRAEAGQRAGGRKRTKTFRQSFLLAYADRLGRRLADTARDTATAAGAEGTGDAGAGWTGEVLPALVAREVAVGEEADRMFPRTTTTRLRGASDRAGWEDGVEAADRARLGGERRGLPEGRGR
ncbi:DUF2786 domain-containing protein [Streptomyces sp. BI20]|uniref:DUF2786 domain-containing protein n=1 Tax=Streptomyces sp. BI20 TaxID=3403460 RepID=UPI003C748A6B